MLHAILGGKRKLEWQRFGPALVVRDIIAFLVLQGSATGYKSFVALADGISHRPKNSLLEKILKIRVLPNPFVMSGSRVEYSTLAFRPDPGPWLGLLVRITRHGIAYHEDGPVLPIMAVMKVSFVPSLDLTYPGNRRVILGNDPWTEDRALVTLESAAYQLVEFGDVGKAPTGAMHGNEPLSFFDKRQKVFPLKRGDLRMIRVKEQSVELIEALGIVQGLPHARDVIEINRIPTQGLRQDRKILIRIMMLGFVTEKKNADWIG